MRELEKQYKALANRRRLQILKYLQQCHQASVTDIAHHLKLTMKATSKHLSQLLGVEAVERDYQGLYMIYRLGNPLKPTIKHALELVK